MIDYEKIRQIDISEINSTNAFFHYTDINNLDSIINNGLEPRVGKNSKGIEINDKVFFSVGIQGVLVLMDAWIKWLMLRPQSDFIYHCGAYFLTQKYFPKIIYDVIFSTWIKSKKRNKRACKKLKRILDNSVFLILDLEENIDFSYNDIDEVKTQKFPRKQLEYIYTYGDDLTNNKIEYWNMHTYVNKIIDKNKISLLKMNDIFCASKILSYMMDNNKEYIQNNCPFLSKYYDYVNEYDEITNDDY